MYRERSQFLDFGADHVYAGVSTWNVVGALVGIIVAFPLAKVLGLADLGTFITIVLSVAICAGVTIRYQSLTIGKRVLLLLDHDRRRLVSATVVEGAKTSNTGLPVSTGHVAIVDVQPDAWVEA